MGQNSQWLECFPLITSHSPTDQWLDSYTFSCSNCSNHPILVSSEVAQPGLRPPGSAGAAPGGPRPVQARPGQWMPSVGKVLPGFVHRWKTGGFNEYHQNWINTVIFRWHSYGMFWFPWKIGPVRIKAWIIFPKKSENLGSGWSLLGFQSVSRQIAVKRPGSKMAFFSLGVHSIGSHMSWPCHIFAIWPEISPDIDDHQIILLWYPDLLYNWI